MKVCIIGLGVIGLPTALLLRSKGFSVLGVDVDEVLMMKIESGMWSDPEPGLDELFMQDLKVSSSVEPSDVYVIAVPTPLGDDHKSDLQHVHAAADAIQKVARPSDLVILESTCPIGTTSALARRLGCRVAYCPERVLPGNVLEELVRNDRIVGGVDKASTDAAIAFYKQFVDGEVRGTNSRTAEMVKLAENTYRDVNIAFANELSMIAHDAQIDVTELIRLANLHPRVDILKPGPGVGGHCIAVDPWFLIEGSPELAQLARAARLVNDSKVDWVVRQIERAEPKVVACFGLTYKADVTDIRNSTALEVVKELEKSLEVLRVDPYISCTTDVAEAIEKADVVVGLVAHRAFRRVDRRLLKGKKLLDFAGVFENEKDSRHHWDSPRGHQVSSGSPSNETV